MRMNDGPTQQARPAVADFLAVLNAQEGQKMEELPPAGTRGMYRVMGQFADVPRGDIAKVEDRTIPGPAGDIPIRIYDSHPGRETGPVMVFYHGGVGDGVHGLVDDPRAAYALVPPDVAALDVDPGARRKHAPP